MKFRRWEFEEIPTMEFDVRDPFFHKAISEFILTVYDWDMGNLAWLWHFNHDYMIGVKLHKYLIQCISPKLSL